MGWTPVRWTRTPVLGVADARLVNRFTAGHSAALVSQVRRAGGGSAWLRQQLSPGRTDDSWYRTTATWWPAVNASPETLRAWNADGTREFWESAADYQRWLIARRIGSQRQLLEVMTDFWENHFHVPATGEGWMAFRIDYGKAIRSRALGTFADLLRTCILHPAMGVYLSNAESTRRAPNENLGRELLELHTVGREAGYDDRDVRHSSYILTGYRASVWQELKVWYDPDAHWTGPVRVLGFSDPNGARDGRAVTERYLDYLARHPATARRICRELAVRFVGDNPSAALVTRLAKVYLEKDTAITPVLRALITSPEFRASRRSKVRTPEEDLVASYRALGVTLRRPRADDSAANAALWQSGDLGLTPLGWPRPDGRPDTATAWSSPSRMLASFDVHFALAGGWWPSKDVTYRTPRSRLPAKRIRFDQLVDHLCRQVLGVPATAQLLKACCEATGTGRYAMITATHGVVRWQMPRLLGTLLDSPTHLTR